MKSRIAVLLTLDVYVNLSLLALIKRSWLIPTGIVIDPIVSKGKFRSVLIGQLVKLDYVEWFRRVAMSKCVDFQKRKDIYPQMQIWEIWCWFLWNLTFKQGKLSRPGTTTKTRPICGVHQWCSKMVYWWFTDKNLVRRLVETSVSVQHATAAVGLIHLFCGGPSCREIFGLISVWAHHCREACSHLGSRVISQR